ncbi:RNA-dependent RNA polymerase 1 [Araneus ventricosus]|uniref:RNA-dependent RNA polymerase n=1 Tax=Araneus ventricosus TaxID=182803 RepID=A0A4Y2FMF1_ARAVE|nr:RNA-dependent RNA polymerase 1 [Araneus ventricosus]
MSSVLKLVIVFRKSVIDIPAVKENAQLFFEEYHKRNKLNCIVDILAARNVDVDLVYQAELYEMDVLLDYSNCSKIHPGDQFKKIGKDWCDVNKNKLSHLWLRLADRSDLKNKGKQSHPDVDITETAFGTLPTMQHFMQHYRYETKSKDKELMGTFLHNQRFFALYACFNYNVKTTHNGRKYECKYAGQTFKFIVYYKSISRAIINDIPNKEIVQIFFILKNFPFVYCEKKNRKDDKEEIKGGSKAVSLASDQEYQERKWERSLSFGCKCNNSFCFVTDIGKCPVFKIVIARKHRAYGIIERLIQRCAGNTHFFYSKVETEIPMKKLDDFKIFPDNKELFDTIIDRNVVSDKVFACQFAWEVLNSLSLEVQDQIILKYHADPKTPHWNFIRDYLEKCMKNVDALVNALYHVSEFIGRNEVFTFEEAFVKCFHYYQRNPSRFDPPEGMCFVRRLIITPSRLICLPPSEHFDNRIIREYGPENLLRISIQDDNFSKLTFAVQYHTRKKEFMDWVARNLLNSSITIGPRRYEVLAASNSQLREHGLWMFAKDHKGNTAEKIRMWMGNFSHIRNVAKYMARMGQCFSTSEEAVQVELTDDEVLNVADVTNRDYTFSDGIGMISTELADEVRKALNTRLLNRVDESRPHYKPSAFQIRFKGCKGMVVENPHLKGRQLAIRPSMKKFSCDSSNLLEIVKISAPRGLFLNRPLITILEQLGVQANVFLKLQKDMVLDMTDSLIYEKKAWKMMSNLTTLDYPYKKLLKCGICLTQEPFFRSLLLSVYKVAIDQLRAKARIAIPPQYGRNMLGVLDETGTLEYGQVFVQYSEELGNIHSSTNILEGTVVVTKNPCMHPGDVRKLEAINVPALHHIKDCIVFPAKGKRPHPDEMAGSDLDGDEYVLIWYDDLIFPEQNAPPMNYPPNPEVQHPGSIQVPDMIDFLCTYIQNDNIGVLANAHLAWADVHPDGIFSKVCMEIAKKYPLVLDFAKSGFTCYLNSGEKPKLYPDFMEKGAANNSYKSKKALGYLYRVVRNLEACVSKVDVANLEHEVDEMLVYSGWEHYKDSAEYHRREYTKRVKNILKKYGLRSEAEVLTGYVGKMNDYTVNRYERDNALSIARTYIMDAIKRFRMEFYKAFDTEFRTNNIRGSELQKIKYRRASAWYIVTYSNKDSPMLSFPWVLHDLLSEIREKNLISYNRSIPRIHSSFIESSDYELLKITDPGRDVTCYCVSVLHRHVEDWMTKSTLNLTMSSGDSFCSTCFYRIVNNFMKTCVPQCCSFRKRTCQCEDSCSPTKLILEFLKFYATEICPKVGRCSGYTSTGMCKGFRELNLQSIALRTYASLAITKSIQCLSINENGTTALDDNPNEEGDPIRVSVSRDFELLFTDHDEDVKAQLKALSGVKDIFISADKDSQGNWFILVQSIGKGWQRWNLEELIMDEDIVQILKSQLQHAR